MAVLGLGMGFLMQTTMLIAQNSVEQKDLGVASSSATFFRSIGGSFGVSLFGTLFIRSLDNDLTRSIGPAAQAFTGGSGKVHPTKLASMPAAVKEPFYHAIATGLSDVFVWAIPFVALIAVLALFVKEIPLRGGPVADKTVDETADTEPEDAPSALVAAME